MTQAGPASPRPCPSSLPPLVPQSQTRRLASSGSFDPPDASLLAASRPRRPESHPLRPATSLSPQSALQRALHSARSPEAPSPKRTGCLLQLGPGTLTVLSSSLYSERGPLGLPSRPSPPHLRNPWDRAPPTGHWDLASLELSDAPGRHTVQAGALGTSRVCALQLDPSRTLSRRLGGGSHLPKAWGGGATACSRPRFGFPGCPRTLYTVLGSFSPGPVTANSEP